MDYTVLVIIASLVFSAFFSGMEIAYISSNKIHIEIEKKQKGVLAETLKRLTERPSKFIAAMLIGNNIALVVYGFYMGDLLMEWFTSWPTQWPVMRWMVQEGALVTQTIISTLVILVTAEFLPKVLFQIYANSLIKTLAIPAFIFYQLFSLFSTFVIKISDGILRLFFNTKGDEVQIAFSKVELEDYIQEHMDQVEDQDDVDTEIQIFQNALEFSNIKAREIMIPRTELMAVALSDPPRELVKIFTETGYSKLLVYQGTIDNIIGYVHSYALFQKPRTIKGILMPIEFVPETMLISDILNVLTKKRKSIAVVLDEYGGTSGMLTVEDIIEVLFGDIEDEHDSDDLREEVLGAEGYIFSARLEIDYLNETYGFDLPESEEYTTLGGYIVNALGEIPQAAEQIELGGYRFDVLEVSGNKIDAVQLRHLERES